MGTIHLGVAFAAGVASFLSPCCLPLYPSFMSYITGLSVNVLKSDLDSRSARLRVMMHTAAFIAGFSIVFYSLGFGAGLAGELFHSYREWIRMISGAVLIVMGLLLIGLIKPGLLMREWKPGLGRRSAGLAGSLLLGIGFAAGWSPCVGPILAGVIALAASEPAVWFKLMTAYTLGFAVPFFAFAFYIGSIRKLARHSGWIMKMGGLVMILMGFLLFSGKMTQLNIWLQKITPDWLVF